MHSPTLDVLAWCRAARANDHGLLIQLHVLGVPLTRFTEAGRTPLHQHCLRSDTLVLLLALGADPDAPSRAPCDHGWAPLWFVRDGDAVCALVRAGASLTRRDAHGLTAALHHAAAGHAEAVAALLDLGADPEDRGPDGRDVLDGLQCQADAKVDAVLQHYRLALARKQRRFAIAEPRLPSKPGPRSKGEWHEGRGNWDSILSIPPS
jgi:hypothetical protein